MLKIIRGSVASYTLVAGAAAALSALATWQGTVLVTPSAAQPAARRPSHCRGEARAADYP